MRLTLGVIKADIESLGGHISTSQEISTAVDWHVDENSWRLLTDYYLSFTGNDSAILTQSVLRFGTVGPYSSRQLQG